MFNSIEQSQNQITDLLTKILNVLTSRNDKTMFCDVTPDM